MEQSNLLSPGAAGDRSGAALTPDEIRRRLTGRAVGDGKSDAVVALEMGTPAEAAPKMRPSRVPAAVLVPLVENSAGLSVLLTKRTAHLDHHAGQISFPGGKMESTDADPVAAALREAHEEVGLDPARVEILGLLDRYTTITGFLVSPVVGLIRPPLELRLDPFEVAEAFEVPLSFLLDPANRQRHYRESADGLRRYYYAMPYGAYYIWGATAAMLVSFAEALGFGA